MCARLPRELPFPGGSEVAAWTASSTKGPSLPANRSAKMSRMRRLWMLLALCPLALGAAPHRVLIPDPPNPCAECDEWNAPREPFRVFGNTYYVGTAWLSSVLIASDQGLILLDGALPQSAARIDASIRKLGFDTADIRLILNSHAHYDHAGGIAALQRASGATVAASREGAAAIENGGPLRDDPQFAYGASGRFPKVKRVQGVRDGEVLRVGDVAVTAHLTPGHTPGSTTWSWRACEGARCLDVVYADSLNPVSAPGFRFGGTTERPGVEATLRRSIARVAGLPCDILITVHPDAAALDDPGLLMNPQACRAYADRMTQRLDRRLEEERTGGE
jgi:metallo-beta-lactamase class B